MAEEINKAVYGVWQPIETAPRDGSLFMGYWIYKEKKGEIQTLIWKDGHFRLSYDFQYFAKPTHWMPLPTAPDA